MQEQSSTVPMPADPRDPPVLLVRDYPAPPLTLVSRYDPARVSEAALDASVHLAKTAQKAEREQAIQDNLIAAAADLLASQLTDSGFACRVADALPVDIPLRDRQQAGAVAVRLHDPQWQIVSRYRAAQAIRLELQKLLSRHGCAGVIAESDMRAAADTMAGVAQVARMRTWDGTEPVSAREWAKASLGILHISEER